MEFKGLTRNLGSKAFAFAAAVVLWALVGAQRGGQEAFDAGVRFVAVPPGHEINPDQLERVTVILRGPQGRLRELRGTGLAVTVDCSNVYGTDERTVTVSADSLDLPPSVEFVKAAPSQLRFSLQRQDRREVEVRPRFVGEYQAGYELEDFEVRPRTLWIAGPAERVALVEQVGTDPINLSGVVGGRSFVTTAFIADPYLRFEDDPRVTVEVRVRKRPDATP